MLCSTYAAASAAGSGRGVNRTPVAAGRLTRSSAERAPVLAAAIPGDEVPAPPEVDQRVRLDVAARLGAVAAAVREPHALGVAARRGDRRQVLRIDGRAADRRGDRRRPERGDAAAEVRRQHLLELDQRADGGLLDAGHRRPRRGAQPDRDGDRLLLVEQQRRHGGAGAQPVAAGRARSPTRRGSRARAGARRRGGSCARRRPAARPASRPASRGAPGAARGGRGGGRRRWPCDRMVAEIEDRS